MVVLCRTICPTFYVKTSDIRGKTSDMSGKKGFFIFTVSILGYGHALVLLNPCVLQNYPEFRVTA